MIFRDPSLRLGAWENPPKDIMSTSFFQHIQWDSIYERRQDGPWVPEVPPFMLHRRGSSCNTTRTMTTTNGEIPATNSEGTGPLLVFTPHPVQRMTVVEDSAKSPANPNNNNATTNNNAATRRASKQSPTNGTGKTTPRKQNEEEDDNGDEEEVDTASDEDDYESDGEELAMRDSVFVFSTNAHNQLPDWSFIDDAVLQSYSTQDPHNSKNKKGGMKKKKIIFPKKVKNTTKEEEEVVEVEVEVEVSPTTTPPVPAAIATTNSNNNVEEVEAAAVTTDTIVTSTPAAVAISTA